MKWYILQFLKKIVLKWFLHKRGTYSAVHALGFNLAELLARFGIILGVFLTSMEMGIYMFVLLLLGGMSLYIAVSRFNNTNSQ